MKTPDVILQNYLSAISKGDIASIEQLSNDHSLIEIPFLKPNRLVGKAEILKAHREIFANLGELKFTLADIATNDRHAITEGLLEFKGQSGKTSEHQVGIVLETDGESLNRFTLYADARNIRLWSDKSIL